jgi:hypothetical protein
MLKLISATPSVSDWTKHFPLVVVVRVLFFFAKALVDLKISLKKPYARKVRIVLAEKGIPFELITEVPWDSTTSTP